MKYSIVGSIEDGSQAGTTYLVNLEVKSIEEDDGKPPEIREPSFRVNGDSAIHARISLAIEKRRALAFDYTDVNGADSSRRVVPFEIHESRTLGWKILQCFDLAAHENRSFRLDRMSNVSRLD